MRRALLVGLVIFIVSLGCGGSYNENDDEVDAYLEIQREVNTERYYDPDPGYAPPPDYGDDYDVDPCDRWPEYCDYEPDYSDYDNDYEYRSGGGSSAVCYCSSNQYNCENFSTQYEAQRCYEYCLSVVGYDIHWLDGDDDGVACEWNP